MFPLLKEVDQPRRAAGVLHLLENTRLPPEHYDRVLIAASCHINKRARFLNDDGVTCFPVFSFINAAGIRMEDNVGDDVPVIQAHSVLVFRIPGLEWIFDAFGQLVEWGTVIGNKSA